MIDFTRERQGNEWPVNWIHGRRRGSRGTDPPIQVHHLDEHTVILRQSKTLTYEGPFIFLLFGNDRGLLLDTGAVKDSASMPLRGTVDELIAHWLEEHPRDDYELVVAHTHGHRDHIDGDTQFTDRERTTVIPDDAASVATFFGLGEWPRGMTQYDLGGRVLELVPCPGHHDASIAIYDPWTQALFTGDTVYPGRLYVNDAEAFTESLDTLVSVSENRSVSWVVGCHIEMTTTPGVDYPMGTRFQPDEPPLQMTVEQLRSVRDAAHEVRERPGVHVYDDFIIFNGRCILGVVRQLLRANRDRLKELVRS